MAIGNLFKRLTGRAKDEVNLFLEAIQGLAGKKGPKLTNHQKEHVKRNVRRLPPRDRNTALDRLEKIEEKTRPKAQPLRPPRVNQSQRRPGLPEMIYIMGSSNVHSIGYDDQSNTLYVRFLAPIITGSPGSYKVGRKTSAPGSLYAYYSVPPTVYEKMLSATSTGGAVWDLLRIRGTIYGHQYDYANIEGTVAREGQRVTYVPNKATAGGLVPRYLKQPISGREVKSTIRR